MKYYAKKKYYEIISKKIEIKNCPRNFKIDGQSKNCTRTIVRISDNTQNQQPIDYQ